jgi:hypothetical protein
MIISTERNVIKYSPKSSEYAKAEVNVLDEVPQSYSHQGNLELDQTRYIAKTRDHEYVDLEITSYFQKYVHFCEEGHAIMDCPFMPFHIKLGIIIYVEL